MFYQKCPICLGCGNVPGGFYNVSAGHIENWSSSSSQEECRCCQGKGIISCQEELLDQKGYPLKMS